MSEAPTPVRVVLVDDQALVRSGFAMVLSVEPDIEVIGQAGDGRQALEVLAEHPADVVLMDVQMPVMDGIAATAEIVARGLGKVVILTTFDREDYLFDALAAGASGFLLKNADPEDLVDAIHAVAGGHALLAPEATLRVIARLVGGGGGAPGGPDVGGSATAERALVGDLPRDRMARREDRLAATPPGADGGVDGARPADPLSPEDRRAARSLTPREAEVLGLLAQGLSNAEIADRLYLGESTVKTYVSNILAKTGSRDRVQAVVFAYRTGIAGA